jgi:phosphoribosylformylglycinamidine (FGAM) synthase PurS component
LADAQRIAEEMLSNQVIEDVIRVFETPAPGASA